MAENGESKRVLLLNIATLKSLVDISKSFEVICTKSQIYFGRKFTKFRVYACQTKTIFLLFYLWQSKLIYPLLLIWGNLETSLTDLILCEQNISNKYDNWFFFSNWLNTSANAFTPSINDDIIKMLLNNQIWQPRFQLMLSEYSANMCMRIEQLDCVPK